MVRRRRGPLDAPHSLPALAFAVLLLLSLLLAGEVDSAGGAGHASAGVRGSLGDRASSGGAAVSLRGAPERPTPMILRSEMTLPNASAPYGQVANGSSNNGSWNLYVSGLPRRAGVKVFEWVNALPNYWEFGWDNCPQNCDNELIGYGESLNGTYMPYLVSPSSGYRLVNLPGEGNLSITSNWVNLTLTFARGATYRLNFVEQGLPKGTEWCVEAPWYECSTTASMATGRPFPLTELNLTPGEYSYTVLPVAGENVSARVGSVSVPVNGTLNVDRNLAVRLTFWRPYAVTFNETGLPSGTTWSVTIHGVSYSSTAGTPIVVQLANGTYACKVGRVAGYTVRGIPRSVVSVHGSTAVELTYQPRR